MNQSELFLKHSKDIEAIGTQVGKTVASLCRDRYFFNGVPDDQDEGSLEVAFSDSTFLTFSLASDGESVHASIEPLYITEPFEIDEGAHCSWERIFLTNDRSWSKFKGSHLTAVDAVVDRWHKPSGHESISGWVLRFDRGGFVSYWNCGDDAKIALNKLPPQFCGADTSIETIAKPNKADAPDRKNLRGSS